MRNARVLELINSPVFQEELGLFNLEANIPPRLIAADGFAQYERLLPELLGTAQLRASTVDTGLVLIGILPTVTPAHTILDNISANPRYHALNRQILDARGDDVSIDIQGPERVRMQTESIMPEAANTSVQFHLQVTPRTFADYWNASQAIAGVQVALGANSPFLFGRRLWDETRVVLFEQTTDTRPAELKNQAVRPRVWFGERWISSIFDLFEENVRYFPTLLPLCEDEDPEAVIEAGGVPRLGELRLHNGTVYRWNRPVYDIGPDRRTAPAGGEPGALGRTHRGGHARQRRVLLWTGPVHRRGGAAGVDAAAVPGRGAQLLPRLPGRPGRGTGLAGARPDRGRRPGAAPVVAGGGRRARPVRGGTGDPGPAARHHRAAVRHRSQRRHLADRPRCAGWRSTASTAATRCSPC